MCFCCEEGLALHDFVLDGLVTTVVPLFVASLVIDDGLGIPVVRLAACFGTGDGLGMHDFFLAGSALECCGGYDGLVMQLCLEKSEACL